MHLRSVYVLDMLGNVAGLYLFLGTLSLTTIFLRDLFEGATLKNVISSLLKRFLTEESIIFESTSKSIDGGKIPLSAQFPMFHSLSLDISYFVPIQTGFPSIHSIWEFHSLSFSLEIFPTPYRVSVLILSWVGLSGVCLNLLFLFFTFYNCKILILLSHFLQIYVINESNWSFFCK